MTKSFRDVRGGGGVLTFKKQSSSGKSGQGGIT